MLRLFFRILILFSLMPAAGYAGFVEGTHYRVIPVRQSVDDPDKIEVREFFWYGCPHCYALEPHLKKWLKKKPAGVSYVTTPATAPRWLTHARAYYAFEALGVLDKMHAALFEAIHREKRPLKNEVGIAKFASEHGVDGEAFRKAFHSFGVNLKVQQARRLNDAYLINTVPTLVVDGKYLTTSSMAGGNAAIPALLDHLVKKAKRERSKTRAKR